MKPTHAGPILAGAALVLAACAPASAPPPRAEEPGASGVAAERSDQAGIYATVIRQLVTTDHTFGDGPSPFRHIYVVDGAPTVEGRPPWSLTSVDQPFPEELKAAIVSLLEDLPPIEFISDPDSVRLGRQGMEGVKNDGVIITLGPIDRDAGEAQVPAGLWCGGLCGLWLTYVLSVDSGGWTITGTTGPAAIS